MKSYILILIIVMIFFGYTMKNILGVVDVVSKRTEIYNSVLQGK